MKIKKLLAALLCVLCAISLCGCDLLVFDTEELLAPPELTGDMRPIGEETILQHFPNIYKHCLEEGYDVLKEPIPVVPAQHYHMGGIKVNLASRTSMNDLYAVGEASCNGVHGKNRLASNSLLESLVFAQRAADDIVYGINHVDADVEKVDMSAYDDLDSVFAEYKENIFGEMERERTNND